jgi:hypothetical protein
VSIRKLLVEPLLTSFSLRRESLCLSMAVSGMGAPLTANCHSGDQTSSYGLGKLRLLVAVISRSPKKQQSKVGASCESGNARFADHPLKWRAKYQGYYDRTETHCFVNSVGFLCSRMLS